MRHHTTFCIFKCSLLINHSVFREHFDCSNNRRKSVASCNCCRRRTLPPRAGQVPASGKGGWPTAVNWSLSIMPTAAAVCACRERRGASSATRRTPSPCCPMAWSITTVPRPTCATSRSAPCCTDVFIFHLTRVSRWCRSSRDRATRRPAENHAILLEDEPSHCLRTGKVWRLSEVEIQGTRGRILARRGPKQGGDGEETEEILTLDTATVFWRGRENWGCRT
jgi:hypothetical protein